MQATEITQSKALTSASGAASILNASARGYTEAVVQVTGSGTYTVLFEGSVDGTNYLQLTGLSVLDDTTAANTFTAAGAKRYKISGFKFVQARCSSHTNDPTVTIGLAG